MSLYQRLQKRIDALESANNYLHGLREIFVFEEISKKIIESGAKAAHVSVIRQMHSKTKEHHHIYEVYILEGGEGMGEFKKTRITGTTYEDLYEKVKAAGWLDSEIAEQEDDGDLL